MRHHDVTTDGPPRAWRKRLSVAPGPIQKNRRGVVGGSLFLETALVARSRLWRPRSLCRS